jgi:hypothetical protein
MDMHIIRNLVHFLYHVGYSKLGSDSKTLNVYVVFCPKYLNNLKWLALGLYICIFGFYQTGVSSASFEKYP